MASLKKSDYLDCALQLLPIGLAWHRALDGNFAKLFAPRATQLANVNADAHQLVKERILSNAFVLLDDWEAFFGLPECTEINTIDARRAALVAKDNEVGSFNKYYLEELARQNGYEIKVIAHYPHHCLRDCTYPLYPQENAWRVFIYTTSKSIRNMTCLDDVTNELVMIERSKIECFLKRFCYSHLEIIFVYEEGQ
ncbi:putative phage tail protein [Mannheimia massilioguelmaensis]|uniref:putative phage tail protein n=1 Tax=Mannheimia massilioguelmaensis TaxID=1604354 RepID=UPI0005C968EE|nr:putative phage tail protein [Mannheimia massilioguelmaensis]